MMWAATSAMRRVLQEGQMARPRPRDHALSHLNPLTYPLTQVLAPETRPGVSYSLLSGVPCPAAFKGCYTGSRMSGVLRNGAAATPSAASSPETAGSRAGTRSRCLDEPRQNNPNPEQGRPGATPVTVLQAGDQLSGRADRDPARCSSWQRVHRKSHPGGWTPCPRSTKASQPNRLTRLKLPREGSHQDSFDYNLSQTASGSW